MTQTQTSSLLVLTATLLFQFKWTQSQPADLGTFGTQNDVQPGVIYSFPSEVGRLHSSADFYALAFINYTYMRQDGHQVVYAQETAKYGEGQISAVSGPLVHVTNAKDRTDHTACSCDLRGTNGQPLPPKGWIALIKRGECKFDEKVACVYRNGAIGAIVYDFKEVPTLDKMKIDDKTRNITAVFTYKLVGEQLARIVDVENRKLNVSITPGKFGKPPNINRTSVLFVSISFIVLMIISFVWLVFYYVQRFRYLQTKDRKSRQLCTVAKRVIAKIPTKSIKSDETNDIDNDCCAICIEPYTTTDVIRVLPCKHEFHKVCLDPWLLEHRTCPMCKLDILKHYGFVFTGSQESILQLDMDIEDGGIDSGPERTRTHSLSPTFIIQLNNDHTLRRQSASSGSSAARDFNGYHQTDANSSDNAVPTIEAVTNANDHLAPTELRQRAVSLPCTLRKKNSDNSCHGGSNNCYLWAIHLDVMSKRNENCSNCLSPNARHEKEDIECLLLNEHNPCETSASDQLKGTTSVTINESTDDEPCDKEQ